MGIIVVSNLVFVLFFVFISNRCKSQSDLFKIATIIATRGIESIVVSDSDGVEIVSAPSNVLNEDNEARHNSQIVSTIFTLTHEQCEKLAEFKRTNYLMSEYGNSKVLFQANYPPIVITIKADRNSTACDGELLGLVDNVKNVHIC